LNVIRIHLPPLCDRRTDVPLLVAHFIGKYARAFGRKVEGIEADAMALLIEYDFPGNVRELENIVERAVALERGERLTVASLPPDLASLKVRTHRPAEKDLSRRKTLEEMERDAVEQALAETSFRRNAAAILLGIDRTTLWRKIKKYGIAMPEGVEEAASEE
jgi:DNA-binding NtrC family response regulator